eukprot:3020994-Rhodomonas_salina.2
MTQEPSRRRKAHTAREESTAMHSGAARTRQLELRTARGSRFGPTPRARRPRRTGSRTSSRGSRRETPRPSAAAQQHVSRRTPWPLTAALGPNQRPSPMQLEARREPERESGKQTSQSQALVSSQAGVRGSGGLTPSKGTDVAAHDDGGPGCDCGRHNPPFVDLTNPGRHRQSPTATLPSSESLFAGHPSHADPASTSKYVPAAHAQQPADPFTGLYLPRTHAEHATPPAPDPSYPISQMQSVVMPLPAGEWVLGGQLRQAEPPV